MSIEKTRIKFQRCAETGAIIGLVSRKRYAELLKAEVFLKAFAFVVDRIEVRHWNNAAWGETPADYGRK